MNTQIPGASLRQVIELLRLHQQYAKAVGGVYESPLSLLEGYILIEIDVDPSAPLLTLRRTLSVDKSALSRAVARLEKANYLKLSWSSSDKRRRQLALTKKALTFLDFYDQQTKRFYAEHLSRLTIEEIAELQRYQHMISDAAGAPAVRIRSAEHPFVEGVRRVTRALGFAGPSLFGSGYSSMEWQVLAAIERSPGCSQLGPLCKLLSMPRSTLSQFLSRMGRQGLMRRDRSPQDRRASRLSLTEAGQKLLARIEQCGVEILRKAFPSPGPAERLAHILRKQLGVFRPGDESVLRERAEVHLISNDRERQRARGFFVFHLTRLGRYLEAPERLLAPENPVYVLAEGENIGVVCELGKDQGDVPVVNFVYGDALGDSPALSDFLMALLSELSRSKTFRSLILKRHWLPASAAARLPTAVLSEKEVLLMRVD